MRDVLKEMLSDPLVRKVFFSVLILWLSAVIAFVFLITLFPV